MEDITKTDAEPEDTGVVRRLAELTQSADKKQRRAVGNIFRFLALLLALTLISRGTYGVTLARVDTVKPTGSRITDAVTGSAIVSSINTLDAFAPEGLMIAEMMTDDGQRVKNGDALARFFESETFEKLEREKANLEKMYLDLGILESTESTDESALETAQRNLRRAQEDYENIRKSEEDSIAAAQDALDEALNEAAEDPDSTALATALRNLQRAQEDYDYTKEQGETDVAEATAALTTAKKSNPADADESAIESAQRNLQRAQQDYNNIIALGDAEIETARYILETMEAAQLYIGDASDTNDPGDSTDPDNDTDRGAVSELDKARSALAAAKQKAEESRLAAWRRVEDAAVALNKAEQDYFRVLGQSAEDRQDAIDRAQSALDSAQKRAEENLLSALRRVEDAEAAFTKAESDYDNNTRQMSESIINEVDRARSALESAGKKAEENLLSALRRVEDAAASLRKVEQDYGRNENQMLYNAAQNSIGAISLRLDIDAQKSVIDSLEELLINDCILYSNIEGVVSSTMSAGNVTGKTPIVSFRDGAKGFVAQMLIKKTNADKLAVGDECEVTTGGGFMYYNPTVTGTISGISPPNENDMATVVIRLPDIDWTEGQSVEAQIVLSSDNYDFCVPLSAIRSDNTGYYILTVEQNSTVLGIQNIVMRVSVSVVASDADMASIRGPVDRNSMIITAGNKTIAAGDRVRVNES